MCVCVCVCVWGGGTKVANYFKITNFDSVFILPNRATIKKNIRFVSLVN